MEILCGETVLSRADNWYLPARLTQQMNTTLETTETPFGVVVRPLAFQRRTLSSRLLFNPLSPGWETQRAPRPSSSPLRRPRTCCRTWPSCRRPTDARSACWWRPIRKAC